MRTGKERLCLLGENEENTAARVFRVALCATLAGWAAGVLWVLLVVFRGMWWSSSYAPTAVLVVAGVTGLALLPVLLAVVAPFTYFLGTRTRPWHPLLAAIVGAVGALVVLLAYGYLTLGSGEDMAVAVRSFEGQIDAFGGVLLVGAATGSVAAWLTKLESR